MKSQAIKNITILGGGLIGWTAAIGLARGLQGQPVKITLVDEQKEIEPAITIATPHIFDFHKTLGLNDQHILQQGHAQLVSARRYQGWLADVPEFFIGNNTHLPVFKGIELHHCVKRCQAGDYNDYSLAAKAASENKIIISSEERGSLLASFNVGMHLDTAAYCQFLQGAAQQLGVNVIHASVADVIQEPDTEFIRQLKLTNGITLPIDLIIDNSGAYSKIMAKTLDIEYEDNTDNMPFNCIFELQTHSSIAVKSYSTLLASEYGWVEQINMPNKVHYLLYANTQKHDNQEIEKYLLDIANIQDKSAVGIVKHNIRPGKSRRLFYKNCVAIGNAAGYVGSPSISNLVMTQRSISRLLDLFPSRACFDSNAREYERLLMNDYREAEDYFALHCYLASTSVTTSPFYWSLSRTELTQRLQQKIALFSCSGRFDEELNLIVVRQSWIAMMAVCCRESNAYEPLLDSFEEQEVMNFLDRVALDIEQYLIKSNEL